MEWADRGIPLQGLSFCCYKFPLLWRQCEEKQCILSVFPEPLWLLWHQWKDNAKRRQEKKDLKLLLASIPCEMRNCISPHLYSSAIADSFSMGLSTYAFLLSPLQRHLYPWSAHYVALDDWALHSSAAACRWEREVIVWNFPPHRKIKGSRDAALQRSFMGLLICSLQATSLWGYYPAALQSSEPCLCKQCILSLVWTAGEADIWVRDVIYCTSSAH